MPNITNNNTYHISKKTKMKIFTYKEIFIRGVMF